jgi:hypothetical protein
VAAVVPDLRASSEPSVFTASVASISYVGRRHFLALVIDWLRERLRGVEGEVELQVEIWFDHVS